MQNTEPLGKGESVNVKRKRGTGLAKTKPFSQTRIPCRYSIVTLYLYFYYNFFLQRVNFKKFFLSEITQCDVSPLYNIVAIYCHVLSLLG